MENRHSAIGTRHSTPKAFTLIELLVVIGIIVILIGILVPVATRMRRQARVTVTQQLIVAIDAAISQYQSPSDFGDWPGPFDRNAANPFQVKELTGAPQDLKDLATGAIIKPTRSEELLLSIVGGLNISWSPAPPFTPTAFVYNADDVGRGPVGLGKKIRARFKDYMVTSGSLSDVLATGSQFLNDTRIPEFVDSFEGPILYVRAQKGVSDYSAFYGSDGALTDPVTGRALVNKGALFDEVSLYTTNFKIFPTYVTSDTLPGQTRARDRYILISAGPDKIFGTADDITNFGQPKME